MELFFLNKSKLFVNLHPPILTLNFKNLITIIRLDASTLKIWIAPILGRYILFKLKNLIVWAQCDRCSHAEVVDEPIEPETHMLIGP